MRLTSLSSMPLRWTNSALLVWLMRLIEQQHSSEEEHFRWIHGEIVGVEMHGISLAEQMQEHILEIMGPQADLSRKTRVQESTVDRPIRRVVRLEEDACALRNAPFRTNGSSSPHNWPNRQPADGLNPNA
jgi:hypothetical protein